jgi:hypothetical protein
LALGLGLMLGLGDSARAEVIPYAKTLIAQTTISTATTILSDVVSLGQSPETRAVAAQASFLYGSGGTATKVYVQTSLDNGTTWTDVISLTFTTAAGNKVGAVNASVAAPSPSPPTDGTLTDNTTLNGVLGDRLRVKVITTGTYAGATSIKVTLVQR